MGLTGRGCESALLHQFANILLNYVDNRADQPERRVVLNRLGYRNQPINGWPLHIGAKNDCDQQDSYHRYQL